VLFSRAAAVRTPEQVRLMRRAGLVVAEMHERIGAAIRPGVSTGELDRIGREVLAARGATSNFLGYGNPGFPGVICASPNSMVVHGVPSDDVVLRDGDIVSIDCGAIVDGWHGDAAFTAPVGDASPEAHAAGLGVVEGYTGHAIGQAMHEAPNVPNQGEPGTGAKLRRGNVLAIEPMLVLGTIETDILDDDWSVVTADGAWAAHAEHTIAITESGPEVLTRP
jgi:methionyl aminopeptidase